MVSRSSAKVEYGAMSHITRELTWLEMLLLEINLPSQYPSVLHCNSQSVIHIASNPLFHERTKHIKVNCHFVREKV